MAETTRLIAGSSHSQPVKRINAPETATPKLTPASPRAWAMALATFRSLCSPRNRTSAVSPLIATPSDATQITIMPETGCGRYQPLHRLDRDRAHRDQQDDGIEQGREDGGAAEAVGETVGRLAPAEPIRAPGCRQPHHVAEIVSGIGQERHGMADQPIGQFHQHEDEIEREGEGEDAALARMVGMPGLGVAVMRMVVAVIVIALHRPQFAPKAGANRGRARLRA